eukprot:scaffold10199_cov146-Cylindrotheca_fusiformis.AAC.10
MWEVIASKRPEAKNYKKFLSSESVLADRTNWIVRTSLRFPATANEKGESQYTKKQPCGDKKVTLLAYWKIPRTDRGNLTPIGKNNHQ